LFLSAANEGCTKVALTGNLKQPLVHRLRFWAGDEEASNAQMLGAPSILRDKGVCRLLDTVVEEFIATLLNRDQPGSYRLSQTLLSLFSGLLIGHLQCVQITGIAKAGSDFH